jgi:N6-L-threonylcarbamoyladenine synthase
VDGPELANVHEIGATRDDAAGEAFDKVGKLLGLGYPGGPVVDRLAATGDAARAGVDLPRGMSDRRSFEMSFSGIKSAVARHVAGAPGAAGRGRRSRTSARRSSPTVVDVLVGKTCARRTSERLPRVVLAGGVAANRGLRARMAEVCARREIDALRAALRELHGQRGDDRVRGRAGQARVPLSSALVHDLEEADLDPLGGPARELHRRGRVG